MRRGRKNRRLRLPGQAAQIEHAIRQDFVVSARFNRREGLAEQEQRPLFGDIDDGDIRDILQPALTWASERRPAPIGQPIDALSFPRFGLVGRTGDTLHPGSEPAGLLWGLRSGRALDDVTGAAWTRLQPAPNPVGNRFVPAWNQAKVRGHPEMPVDRISRQGIAGRKEAYWWFARIVRFGANSDDAGRAGNGDVNGRPDGGGQRWLAQMLARHDGFFAFIPRFLEQEEDVVLRDGRRLPCLNVEPPLHGQTAGRVQDSSRLHGTVCRLDEYGTNGGRASPVLNGDCTGTCNRARAQLRHFQGHTWRNPGRSDLREAWLLIRRLLFCIIRIWSLPEIRQDQRLGLALVAGLREQNHVILTAMTAIQHDDRADLLMAVRRLRQILAHGERVALKIWLAEEDSFHILRQAGRTKLGQMIRGHAPVQAFLQSHRRAAISWLGVEPDGPIHRRWPHPGFDGEAMRQVGHLAAQIAWVLML